MFAQSAHIDFGEPQATAQAVLQIVDAPQPPLRFFLGTEGMSLTNVANCVRLALRIQAIARYMAKSCAIRV